MLTLYRKQQSIKSAKDYEKEIYSLRQKHEKEILSLRKNYFNEVYSLKQQYYWFKWYHSEYSSTLRMLQYNQPTLDINDKLVAFRNEFIPIEQVTRKMFVPPTSHGPFSDDFIYFGARAIYLQHTGTNNIDLYATSYLGNAEFAHSNKVFDAFIKMPELIDTTNEIAPCKYSGLQDKWLENNSRNKLEHAYSGENKHLRPFSYNTGDLDGDGKADFILGGEIKLSSNHYENTEIKVALESIFVRTGESDLIVELIDDEVIVSKYNENALHEIARGKTSATPYQNIPHVLIPLPFNQDYPPLFGLRTIRGLDIYHLDENFKPILRGWISGLAENEILIGAFGDFTGDGLTDFWISQVATGVKCHLCADQVLLISMKNLLEHPNGEIPLSSILYFSIKGSDKYSDYDGISTSLSPIAGDIDADGKPDLSFVGHRHMNEAGALYILRNKFITKGGCIDITNTHVIKILGRPMSQLAPPYRHWDATDLSGDGHDDIIVAADNDLYSGLHAGAIYVLDGKKIIAASDNI